MSVLLQGLSMPKGNPRTINLYKDGTWCDAYTTEDGKAIEVQTPRGRLIDADAFIAEQRHLYCENCERRKGMKNGKVKFVYDIGDAPCRACGYGDVLDDLEDAPTIIVAEDGST